jgi:hypothetical protein
MVNDYKNSNKPSSSPFYWNSKVDSTYNQILVMTVKEILKDKDIISGDMEFDQYLEKVLAANNKEYMTLINKYAFMRNYCEILEKPESLSEEDEKYIKEHALDYFDDMKTEEDVNNLIKELKDRKALYDLFNFSDLMKNKDDKKE